MNDNDNEDNEEEVDEELPRLSEYERLRARNIAERKRKYDEAGLEPHSQVTKRWKRK